MFIKVLQLSIKNRYHVVHAVEESVFMAIILKSIFGLPYVYDMDSSMPQQLMEKFPQLQIVKKIMCFFEGRAIKKSEAVIPVCNALGEIAEKQHPKRIMLLPDISLLDEPSGAIRTDQIKQRYGIQGLMMMYVGNLERYQGIDLLLESFAPVLTQIPTTALVIIGGTSQHIQKYREKAFQLGVSEGVYFLGTKPVDQLGAYLVEADILVSPRIQGNNTPMKIYSYLHSGKPLLATDLQTHTQVLDRRVALLAAAVPEAFSEGMMCLLGDKTLRERIGAAGQKLIEENYSFDSFRKKLSGLYDVLEAELVESSCSR